MMDSTKLTSLLSYLGSSIPRIAFPFGAVVYLRLRQEKAPGMVTGYVIRPSGVCYQISWADTGTETGHYEMELTSEYDPFNQ